MGSSGSKEIYAIMNIGERDFPRILFTSLCGENQNKQRLALSMRAAGLLGSLLDQLSRIHVSGDEELDASSSRDVHTILLSDGNSYHLDTEFFRNYNRLRSTLAGIQELMVTHSSGGTLQDYLDLSPFLTVHTLTLTDVPVHLIHYLKLLRPTLQCLRAHRCIDNLKKLFEACGGDQAFPALWTRLSVVDLRWNNLISIDDSLKLLPFLHTLDLSYNRLTDIAGLECLTAIQVLNLSYNCLSNVPTLMQDSRKNLQVLLMRFNRISSLQGIDEFSGLRSLDVSNNNIMDQSQLRKLKQLRYLAKLDVQSNPFEAIQKIKRKQLLENLSTLVPIDFMLNGRLLSGRENYYLRKVRVNRVPSSSTPMTMSIVNNSLINHPNINLSLGVASNTQADHSPHMTWIEASQESTRRDVNTGGSEADVSSSDAEGYLANSLTALARQTRHHLDHVRGRYGKNWLVNWNQTEIGRNIPSPPPGLINPGQPATQSTPQDNAITHVEMNNTSTSERKMSEETVKNAYVPEERIVDVEPAVDQAEGQVGQKEEDTGEAENSSRGTTTVDLEDTSSSQLYVTAPSEFDVSAPTTDSPVKREEPPEVYPLKWEQDDEDNADLTVDGSTFVVTQLDNSRPGVNGVDTDQRCMLVVGERHIQTCCVSTGEPLETLELRLLTSVRRDGSSLFLGFRYVDQNQRSRSFHFSQSQDCERCHSELARHLLDDPPSSAVNSGTNSSKGDGNAMHCFRCRNRVPAEQVARILEVEPSTGERVLVPTCPFCGLRALAEDSDDENCRNIPIANGRSPTPRSTHSNSSVRSHRSLKEDFNGNPKSLVLPASPRLSASGCSSPSALRLVSCEWIKFDHSDFTDFDHQIKYHFALNVLQSDKEECRLMIKCHGTPYNRADVFECVLLFTNRKYYFFKWKFHESQTVAKCLTLQDKIDLKNLVRVRSGPCFQWLMLDFKNSKRCLVFPGDPKASELFLHQLSESLDLPVVHFNTEEDERKDFCVQSLTSLDHDSGEQIASHHLYMDHAEEEETLSDTVRMWICRCPRTKYNPGPQLSNLSVWTGRESKRDWSLLVLTNVYLMLFDVEYLVGMEKPKTKPVYKWSVTDVSAVKQGRDGLTLVVRFYQPKDAEEKNLKYNDLPVVFENDLVVQHFFSHFKHSWEQFYGFPLKMK